MQENGFTCIKGHRINCWVLCSPPVQKFLDFVGVIGEVFGRLPSTLIKGIPVNRS